MEIPAIDSCLKVCITGDIDDFNSETIEKLKPYISILDKYGIRATFFITAKAAENYPERLEFLLKSNQVIEGHGDVHEAFYQSEMVQIDRLNSMKKTFSDVFDIDIEGFRAPWYKHNTSTYLAVDKAGLKYDCSKKRFEIAFKGIPFFRKKYMYTWMYPYYKPLLKLIASLYNSYSNSPRIPYYLTANVIEFPTLGISDYTLIQDPEGPKFHPAESIKIGEIWMECLTSFKQSGGGIMTIQVHPGRLSPLYLNSLDYFIQQALRLGVEFSTPSNIINNV